MKKFFRGFFLLFFGILLWYLFLKPSDYIIRFEAKTFPGTINQTLKLWHNSLDTVGSVVQKGENIKQLRQRLRFGDSIHRYDWSIQPLTDSTSKVIVSVKDENNSLSNKIKVPFTDTDFEKRSRKTVLDFMENLNDHIDKFKVTIIGEDEIPTKYLAYIPVETVQSKKAGGMMKNYTYLTQTLRDSGVRFDGPPMIIVNNWNKKYDSITYDFAQPIIRSERLPMGTDIEYRRIFKKKALKAIYNGNYITSDRAWYALSDYAKKKDIKVELTPIEIFYNNPHTDGGETTWKAEIYLPIEQNEE